MDFQNTAVLPSIRLLFPSLFPEMVKKEFITFPSVSGSPNTDRMSSSSSFTGTPMSASQGYSEHLKSRSFCQSCTYCKYQISRAIRTRRKKEAVHRYYSCVHPGCQKAYGSLSHLNTHVFAKGHGPKRLPSEFSKLRQNLRHKNDYLLKATIPVPRQNQC